MAAARRDASGPKSTYKLSVVPENKTVWFHCFVRRNYVYHPLSPFDGMSSNASSPWILGLSGLGMFRALLSWYNFHTVTYVRFTLYGIIECEHGFEISLDTSKTTWCMYQLPRSCQGKREKIMSYILCGPRRLRYIMRSDYVLSYYLLGLNS